MAPPLSGASAGHGLAGARRPAGLRPPLPSLVGTVPLCPSEPSGAMARGAVAWGRPGEAVVAEMRWVLG